MSHANRKANRRARAKALRAEGLSIRQIADRLNVGRSTVHRDLDAEEPARTPIANLQDANGRPVAGADAGNTRAVRHGADSTRLVEPRAKELAPGVLAANPHLDERRDGPAVWRYALILARLERGYAWLAGQPDEVFADVDAGDVHGLFSRLERWEKQATGDEERLAIAPLTRTKLGLDQARGAEAAAEAWKAMREAGELARGRVAAIDGRVAE